jgi:hypothetical protein
MFKFCLDRINFEEDYFLDRVDLFFQNIFTNNLEY